MKTINQNIFNGQWHGMVHCCNLYHTFGAGIAKQIKIKYPNAYKVDCESTHGDSLKLGFFTHSDEEENKTIYNLYGQVGIGNDKNPLNRNCQYDYIHDGIWRICEFILDSKDDRPYHLAIPYKMASDRAGGSWGIIEAILSDIEYRFSPHIEFHIYKLD
jgi:hypothetical protein